jgi:hypothetical protein
MCRYAWHNYRDHFACFPCRKAFKYWQWEDCVEGEWKAKARQHRVPRETVCPECSRPMVDMGLDFKAPPKGDRGAWQILEALHRNGFTFHGCGCSVGFTPPRTLREVPGWLEEHRKLGRGESALKKFEGRTGGRGRGPWPPGADSRSRGSARTS